MVLTHRRGRVAQQKRTKRAVQAHTMALRGGQARIVDTQRGQAGESKPAKKAGGSFTDNSSEETTLEKPSAAENPS
jgi:hypothetical protein